MMTARDSLLLEILTLTKCPYSESSKIHMTKKLAGYRIQAKPNVLLRDEMTAREMLGEALLQVWQTIGDADAEDKIKESIDCYRMQYKQGNKTKDSKEAKTGSVGGAAALASSFAQDPSKVISISGKRVGGPIAGGPKKRQYSRSECPKCHSMGVVLARASSGDGYFSCIYCGFQAYRGRLDSDLDLPLAAELLGRRFDEEKEV